jgi:hypothetical protein
MKKTIQVQVSCGFLYDIFPRQGHSISSKIAQIEKSLTQGNDEHWTKEYSQQDLNQTTISKVLTDFHNSLQKAVQLVWPDLGESLVDQFTRLAKEGYFHHSFSTDTRTAINFLGIHRLQVHGFLSCQAGRHPVFIPDLSNSSRICFYPNDPDNVATPIRFFSDNPHWLKTLGGLDSITIHLCDSLQAAIDRAKLISTNLAELARNDQLASVVLPSAKGSTFLIDVIVRGFRGFRSLRDTHPSMPVLGRNAFLNNSSIRQGHALPIMSKFFPIALWDDLSVSSKDAVVEASQSLASSWVPVLRCDTPTQEAMERLMAIGGIAEGDVDVSSMIEHEREEFLKLGILDAVLHRNEGSNYIERLEQGKWAWDWTWAISELKIALYENDVKSSAALTRRYHLQVLHKRLISLLETEIVVPLRRKMIEKQWVPPSGKTMSASGIWKDAFKTQETAKSLYDDWPDQAASIAVDATWLRLAESNDEFVPLSDLFDAVIDELHNIPANSELRISLAPASPQDHAESLATIASNGVSSQALTLCVGRLLFGLRNFVEHGIGEVSTNGLVLSNEEFWESNRQYSPPGARSGSRGSNVTLFDWVNCVAADTKWPRRSELPNSLPKSASRLLLDEKSLIRTLSSVAIVLHGAFSHLHINGLKSKDAAERQ